MDGDDRQYQFPVRDGIDAREVTLPDFAIEPNGQLYVKLGSIRGTEYFDDIKYNLNIQSDRLQRPTTSYVKFIFSGHRGSGKTLELQRLHAYCNHAERYCSILIELEKEIDLSMFEPEDLFLLLITGLLNRAKQDKLKINTDELDRLAEEWLCDKEFKSEFDKSYQAELSGEAGGGASFFGFLAVKGRLKSMFGYRSKHSELIRKKIKNNPIELIQRFNAVLQDFRKNLNKGEKDHSRDLLFIVDGSEKIDYEKYMRLFIRDSNLIRSLGANIILSVPIDVFYNIEANPRANFEHMFVLPMVRTEKDGGGRFAEIIGRRIDKKAFFEKGVLHYCVGKSGGCPRQLLLIVNACIVSAQGGVISSAIAERSVERLGRRLFDSLDSEHVAILRDIPDETGEPKVRDLLLSLALLKYNGEKRLNPLLEEFIKPHQNG